MPSTRLGRAAVFFAFLMLATPLLGFRPTETIELIPGVFITYFSDEVGSARRPQQSLASDDLRRRIDSLKMLTAGYYGEQAREPKIELFAAYLILRERGQTTTEQAEEIFSIITSDPSIVAAGRADFSYSRSLPDAISGVLPQRIRPVSDERTGLVLGFLEADPVETVSHLSPGQPREIVRRFRPAGNRPFVNSGVVYEILVEVAPTTLRNGTLLPNKGKAETIIEKGELKTAEWRYEIRVEEGFEEAEIRFHAELRRYETNTAFKKGNPSFKDKIIVPISTVALKKKESGFGVWFKELLDLLEKLFGIIGAPVTILSGLIGIIQYRENRRLKLGAREKKDLAVRWAEEVWSQGKLSFADEMFAEKYLHNDPATPDCGAGPEGEKRRVNAFRSALPDLRLLVEDQIVDGDFLVARWRLRGTHKGHFREAEPSGKEITTTGVTIFRVVEGKVVEGWVNWDSLGFMQQLGFQCLYPAKPATTGPTGAP